MDRQVDWCIFYNDRSVFTSLDGSPADAPGGGVVAIASEDPQVGCLIHHGTDFYIYDEAQGGWVGMDQWGLCQHLIDPGQKVIKLGRHMPTAEYMSFVNRIREFGLQKSARYPWEVKT